MFLLQMVASVVETAVEEASKMATVRPASSSLTAFFRSQEVVKPEICL